MAVKNLNGHGVTTVLSGAATNIVIPAKVVFPSAPTFDGGQPQD